MNPDKIQDPNGDFCLSCHQWDYKYLMPTLKGGTKIPSKCTATNFDKEWPKADSSDWANCTGKCVSACEKGWFGLTKESEANHHNRLPTA